MNKQYWQTEALNLRNNLNNASQQNQADRDAKDKALKEANNEKHHSKALSNIIESYSEENHQLRDQISEMEAKYSKIIRGWMLNQQAYRKLAMEYGKQLGMDEETVIADWPDAIFEVAAKDPETYKDTETYGKAVKRKEDQMNRTSNKGP